MSKKVNKLTEPNMRLYFLLAAVFCAVTLWIEPILGLVEAGVMALTYVYFRRTAQKRRGPEGRFSEMLYLFRMHMPKSRLSAAAESLLFV